MKSLQELINLSFDMDIELGSIGCRVETLSDVEYSLSLLAYKMTNIIDRKAGEETVYVHEWVQQIRVLTELLRYSMNDLKPSYEEATDINNQIIKIIKES